MLDSSGCSVTPRTGKSRHGLLYFSTNAVTSGQTVDAPSHTRCIEIPRGPHRLTRARSPAVGSGGPQRDLVLIMGKFRNQCHVMTWDAWHWEQINGRCLAMLGPLIHPMSSCHQLSKSPSERCGEPTLVGADTWVRSVRGWGGYVGPNRSAPSEESLSPDSSAHGCCADVMWPDPSMTRAPPVSLRPDSPLAQAV